MRNRLDTVGDWWIDLDAHFCVKQEDWNPSTDIKDAYRALRQCIKRVPQKDMHIEHLDGAGWCCSTCFDEENIDGKNKRWKMTHKAETLPQAICVVSLLWSQPQDMEFVWPAGVVLPVEEEENN